MNSLCTYNIVCMYNLYVFNVIEICFNHFYLYKGYYFSTIFDQGVRNY